MADSLPVADLGSFPVFPLSPNWSSDPSSQIAFARDVIREPGTSHALVSITDDAPISFEAAFTIFTPAEYLSLMTFWVARRGRVNRFWVKHPYRSFKLKEDAGSGDGIIHCYPNSFELQYQGYERLYVVMDDGDTVAREITAATYDSGNDRLSLSLNTVLDRDLTTTNHIIIGRYLLARFDADDLDLELVTDCVSNFSLSFAELVREYDEI